MANLTIQGIFARNRWDFLEKACGHADIGVLAPPAGGYFLALLNPATSPSQLDIYRADFTTIDAGQATLYAVGPGQLKTPAGLSTAISIFTIDPTLSSQPGQLLNWSAVSGEPLAIYARLDQVTSASYELATGGPFLTLQPGWAVAWFFDTGSSASESEAHFVYQAVNDQLAQAS